MHGVSDMHPLSIFLPNTVSIASWGSSTVSELMS
jgi:hypothetical protein